MSFVILSVYPERMTDKEIHIIAGPTAGGKSALAMERAAALGGAVVNVDSRQIYDGLPILTARPSPADMAAVPHHLYGTLHPDTPCSAGLWREMALPLLSGLLDRGITPIVTGGTGLYIRMLTEGLSPIPMIPEEIRDAANAEQQRLGNPAFHAALAARDPVTAAQYHPMQTARLIHAWEVLEATGKPLSYFQSLPREGPPEGWRFRITLVIPPRDVLYRRCNDRFEAMLKAGAAEELEAFDSAVAQGHISKDSLLVKTVGAQGLRLWQRGEVGKEEAVSLAQAETRHYAKRQTTWFRNQVRPQKNIAEITVQA